MTILGRGDLSPPRRGHYGRRRRRWPRVLLVLVVLAALGAGGYYGWHRWHGSNDAAVRTTSRPCLPVARTPAPLPRPTGSVRVLNGNLRAGLAKQVARQLHGRFGLIVARVGNAPHFVRGRSLVRYPAKLRPDARLVEAMLVPSPRLVVAPALPKVEIDLGTGFRRVVSVAEYRTATGSTPTSATPTPAPSPTACTPTPS